MLEVFAAYHDAVVGLFALAVLFLFQFGVADVAGIRAKHVPGTPVTGGHDSFLFRATRAHANSYENLGLFLLLVLVCVLAGAGAKWVCNWIWVFVAARTAYMVCYYADLRTLRSVMFGIGGLAQLGLLGCAFLAI